LREGETEERERKMERGRHGVFKRDMKEEVHIWRDFERQRNRENVKGEMKRKIEGKMDMKIEIEMEREKERRTEGERKRDTDKDIETN
jgi:hypothetical protein